MSWGELVARLADELTEAKFKAEGDASQLQQLFGQSPEALIKAQADYTAAAASNNGVSAYLQVLLRSGKTPQAQTPNLDQSRALFATFEDDVVQLRDRASDARGFASSDTGLIPSLLDITKVFDVILKAIEWFKERHDKQREEVAQLLQSTMWRQWANAGDFPPPAAPEKSSEPQPLVRKHEA